MMMRSLRASMALALAANIGSCLADCIPLKQQLHPRNELQANPKTQIMEIVAFPPVSGQRTVVNKPGNYCLTENLWVNGSHQPWRWDGPTFFSDDKVVLVLGSSNIDVDLQQHSVGSDGRLVSAVTTSQEVEAPVTKRQRAEQDPPYLNITIRRGVIDPSRGNRAVLIAGLEPLETDISDVHEGYPARNDDSDRSTAYDELDRSVWARKLGEQIKRTADYPVRNLRLQDLRIKSSLPAVVLQGAGSVIKDSVIESDSGTAIQIHGPNAVIENNTIIVRCRKSKLTDIDRSTCFSKDAAIRLVHADGAVIRNNRFFIEGASAKRVLSVFGTKGFLFEGNVIKGLDNLGQIADSFNGEISGDFLSNRIDESLRLPR